MAMWDEYGFPTGSLTRKQAQRMRVRAFTTANHWRNAFPTVGDAVGAVNTHPGSLASLTTAHGMLPEYRSALYAALVKAGDGGPAAGTSYAALVANGFAAEDDSRVPADMRKQIELDLPRTFCEQRDFAEAVAALRQRGDGRGEGHALDGSVSSAVARAVTCAASGVGGGSVMDALRRMLRAFCALHPEQGYLQSMNFVAGFMLLVHAQGQAQGTTTPMAAPTHGEGSGVWAGLTAECRAAAEEAAFWVFDHVISRQLAGYYTPDLAHLHADCTVFRWALQRNMPALYAHLTTMGMADIASLFLPRWLLCVYLNVFHAPMTVRVWDVVLLAGREAPCVLLQVALAVVRMCQDTLLACRSFVDVVETLKVAGERVDDVSELMLLTQRPECSLTTLMPGAPHLDSATCTASTACTGGSTSGEEGGAHAAATVPFIQLLRQHVQAGEGGAHPTLSPGLASPGGTQVGGTRAAAVGTKRRRTMLAAAVGSPAAAPGGGSGVQSPVPTPRVATLRGVISPPSTVTPPSHTPARPSPCRTPPVAITTGLDRVLSPLTARKVAGMAGGGGTSMPSPRSPVIGTPSGAGVRHVTTSLFGGVTSSRGSAVVLAPLSVARQGPPPTLPLFAIAEALNPSVAHGLASARKRRAPTAAVPASAAKPVVAPTAMAATTPAKAGASGLLASFTSRTAVAVAVPPATPRTADAAGPGGLTTSTPAPSFPTAYSDYDEDTVHDVEVMSSGNFAELMAFGPRSVKRTRCGGNGGDNGSVLCLSASTPAPSFSVLASSIVRGGAEGTVPGASSASLASRSACGMHGGGGLPTPASPLHASAMRTSNAGSGVAMGKGFKAGLGGGGGGGGSGVMGRMGSPLASPQPPTIPAVATTTMQGI